MASTDHRKYRLKARAERQDQTRQRIVEATAALHREVGPARTTIADIARRAGVQRLTVYNHFPELRGLFGACQQLFLTQSPPPDIGPGDASPGTALDRLEAALAALYGWFRANEGMQRNVQRDRRLLPELDELMRENADPRFDGAAADYAGLIAGRAVGRAAVRALVRLAFDFRTWEVLAGQGLDDAEIAALMRRAVYAAAG